MGIAMELLLTDGTEIRRWLNINRHSVWVHVQALLVFLIAIGLAVEVGEPMPDNAVLIVDDYQHRYYPPYRHVEEKLRHLHGNRYSIHVRLATAEEAHSLGYSPDPESREAGDFVGPCRKLLIASVQWILRLPVRHRWNLDGSWNW